LACSTLASRRRCPSWKRAPLISPGISREGRPRRQAAAANGAPNSKRNMSRREASDTIAPRNCNHARAQSVQQNVMGWLAVAPPVGKPPEGGHEPPLAVPSEYLRPGVSEVAMLM